MKVMRYSAFIILLVLCSCAGAVRVSPLSCESEALWGNKPKGDFESISITERFFVSSFWGDDRVIRPEKMLSQHDLTCEQVVNYSVRIEQDLWSVLGQLILQPNVLLSLDLKYRDQEMEVLEEDGF